MSILPITLHSRNFRHYCESRRFEAFAENICDLKPPTREEEISLFRRYRAGDKSVKEEIVLRNQRLVIKAAAYYASAAKMPIEDLYTAGNIGLLEAIEKFDPDMDARFITFAIWIVRSKLQRELAKIARVVSVPPHAHVYLMQYRNAIKEMVKEGYCKDYITAEMAAERMGRGLTYAQAAQAISADNKSLNVPKHNDPNSEDQINLIESPCTQLDEAVENNTAHIVRRMLDDLPARDSEILAYRFGIFDGEYKSFDKVGEKYGLSRERIRQICDKCMATVRDKMRFAYVRELAS